MIRSLPRCIRALPGSHWVRRGASGASGRGLSTPARAAARLATVGAVFDIDGVVLRGETVLPNAREGILRLKRAGVPFIFLTNGGGVMEAKKAAQLSEVLGTEISGSQVICSHTPLQAQVPHFRKDRVLIMGCREVMTVARQYGFERPVSIDMLASDDPTRYPFFRYDHRPLPDRDDPIKAVFILHDPVNWAPDLQIALDVIRGGSPLGSGTKQAIPVFASNPDFLFSGSNPVPRFACGAFVECLEHLFTKLTGETLQVQRVGKPLKVTFDFARYLLGRWRDHTWRAATDEAVADPTAPFSSHAVHTSTELEVPAFTDIFMVGDNPAADIRGANRAGKPWHSVLVRTGVFGSLDPRRERANDPVDPANHVVEGVGEAIDLILRTHEAQQAQQARS